VVLLCVVFAHAVVFSTYLFSLLLLLVGTAISFLSHLSLTSVLSLSLSAYFHFPSTHSPAMSFVLLPFDLFSPLFAL